MRLLFIILLSSCLTLSYSSVHYYLGELGQSCFEVCYNQGKNCHPRIVTHNNTSLYTRLGLTCEPDNTEWWSEEQPSYDPVNKRCVGFIGVPDATQCSASDISAQRICRCDDPDDKALPSFGTGFSNGNVTMTEKWMFQHFVTPGNIGVISHLWVTYPLRVEAGLLIRYYIDGEKEASIQFTPSMACGVGFYDQLAPWGTEWFGKGANNSGWYNNFRIPFQKSIVVTIQHLYNNHSRFFFMIKGSINLPIVVGVKGGKNLPSTAKMNQARINNTYQVLEWVPLVSVPSGPGVHWMVTLAVESTNNKFLEGCIHAYLNGNNEFPGVIIGTGLEDYLDSGFFFNAGLYHMPSSGYTHIFENDTYISWSGYRFHDQDPMFFDNGFQLIWRNGDMDDNAGMKCHTISGGKIHGDPTESQIYAYSWYYTWPTPETPVEKNIESMIPVKFLGVVFFIILTLATLKNAFEFFKIVKVNVVSFFNKSEQAGRRKSVSYESSSTNWTT